MLRASKVLKRGASPPTTSQGAPPASKRCLSSATTSQAATQVDTVNHEVAENVVVTQTGGPLGSRPNCRECPKNPGHPTFIPAYKFMLEDLDVLGGKTLGLFGGAKVDHMYDLIKSTIPITVRIHSTFVSKARPDEKYPMCKRRGEELKYVRNVGSGWVQEVYDMEDKYVCDSCGESWKIECERGVYKCPGYFLDNCKGRWRMTKEENDGKCPKCQRVWWVKEENGKCRCRNCGGTGTKGCGCSRCLESGIREEKYWCFAINTARHVIYDCSEARTCEVVFFDDGGNVEPVKLTGGFVSVADTEGDCCELYMYTHDIGLVEKMKKLCDQQEKMAGRIIGEQDFSAGRDSRGANGDEVIKPYFLVGYPHGRHCHVTVGEKLSEDECMSGVAMYRVNSCEGNSGCVGVALGDQYPDVLSRPHSCRSDDPGVGESANLIQ